MKISGLLSKSKRAFRWFTSPNYLRSLISCRRRLLKSWGMPTTYCIEPTNLCDQKCPICETGLGLLRRPKGFMGLPEFKHIAEKILPYAHNVSLYWMGEPMLNKNIYDMIGYLKRRKPHVYVAIASDGNLVDPERLVASGLDEIEFKINGIDQATHSIYRVGGSFDKVVNTIKDIVRIKKAKGVHHPRISAGIIVMRHNEHQLDAWEEFCRQELECDVLRYVTPSVRTVEQAHLMLPQDRRWWRYDETELSLGNLRSLDRPGPALCEKVWNELYVTWEGSAHPCCFFLDGEYPLGNLLEQDLPEIWNSQRMQEFRRLMCDISKEQFIPCRDRCTGARSFITPLSYLRSRYRISSS